MLEVNWTEGFPCVLHRDNLDNATHVQECQIAFFSQNQAASTYICVCSVFNVKIIFFI